MQVADPLTDQIPQSPLHAIPDNGDADGLGHDKTGTRRAHRFIADLRVHQVHDDRAASRAPTTPNRRGEFTVAAEPLGGGQHPMLLAALRPKGGRGP
ncbi:hypothetical protein GCM10023322_41060 [Rugosimonospora acidiphila]|uniref:Uncharacterized protein n=1 Tax=Rugosimonospora acidiphila TaxID=556531 RepID=A0ABP9RZH2_9ACTN